MTIPSPIPITVFTGFLGAGKTSIILSLLPKLPKDYKVVLLKNEFGDIEVDSKLAQQSSLAGVSEILNGCMCCVLVGQMQTALLEIRDKFHPDRILIECSGSAFPATLAFQIRELERQTSDGIKLDAIVTVVDAENFVGYEDTSPTAKMQASYTDMILINKWEHISERAFDIVLDHLNTLNDLTPKIKCKGRDGVDPNLLFGLGTKLFTENNQPAVPSHNDEVETVTIYRGFWSPHKPHEHNHSDDQCDCARDTPEDAGTDGHGLREDSNNEAVERDVLEGALQELPKESIWRVKGFVRLKTGRTLGSSNERARTQVYILNWAFGRYDLTLFLSETVEESGAIRLTVMGERGEVRRAIRRFSASLSAQVV